MESPHRLERDDRLDIMLEQVVETFEPAEMPEGIGIDVVALDRIGRHVSIEALGARIASSDGCIPDVSSASATEIAQLVAVKEAASKALGTGIIKWVGWKELVVPTLQPLPFDVSNRSTVESTIRASVDTFDAHAVAVAASNATIDTNP